MKPYRTTPPPTKGDLIAWACAECAAWPATTPQGNAYTYWVRYAQKHRRPVRTMQQTMQQTKMHLT